MMLPGALFRENLQETELTKFITSPEEKIVLGVREHYVFLIFRVIKIALVTTGAGFFLALISGILLQKPLLLTFTLILTALTGLSLILQEVVHWYFHMYIVTTRKILEVKYHPLISETTNSVLLDQIKCTEIDAEVHGFIPELLDMGDIKITFDRPTHQEEFVLRSIRSPRRVASALSAKLNENHGEQSEKNILRMWYRDRLTNKLKFMEQNYGYPSN